jgi:hypothetical protein
MEGIAAKAQPTNRLRQVASTAVLLLCSVLVLVFSSTNFLLLCACDLLLCYTTFSGQVNFIVIKLIDVRN